MTAESMDDWEPEGLPIPFWKPRVPIGERMLAGVMLKKKTPPSLELTPFLVEGLTGEVALEQVLLIRAGGAERYRGMADLRQKLGQEGITLNVCDSVGQYTSTLFELGITPMRMEAYAERDKVQPDASDEHVWRIVQFHSERTPGDYLLRPKIYIPCATTWPGCGKTWMPAESPTGRS